MNDCNGTFGRLFGHNYRPVFNSIPPSTIDSVSGSRAGIMELIEKMTRTEYVHTCCTRCGDVLEVGK